MIEFFLFLILTLFSYSAVTALLKINIALGVTLGFVLAPFAWIFIFVVYEIVHKFTGKLMRFFK